MPFGNRYTLVDPGPQSNYDGDIVAVTVATAGNGDKTNIAASGLPAGLSLNGSGVVSGTIASNADASGPYTAALSVTDIVTGTTTSETIDWAVSHGNRNVLELVRPEYRY